MYQTFLAKLEAKRQDFLELANCFNDDDDDDDDVPKNDKAS